MVKVEHTFPCCSLTSKTTLETGGEDVKTTLETGGEDVKTTLETGGEDVKTTLVTSEEDLKIHSKRVGKMYLENRTSSASALVAGIL